MTFEESVTKQQMEQQETILLIAASQQQPSDEDRRALIKRLRQARIRSSQASCWSCGYESELLWRYYCADNNCPGVGVALRTTLARLEASVEVHNLYVRAIKYRDYQEAPPFTGDMSPLFHKRHGFADERELRLLKFNEEHFQTLIPKDASVPELDEYIYLSWALGDVIDKIIISPYADEDYEQRVRDAIQKADSTLADRVALSELHERQNPPHF